MTEIQRKKARVIAHPSLNLRDKPSGETLVRIPYSHVVNVIDWDTNPEWAYVVYGEQVGFVKNSYLKELAEGEDEHLLVEESEEPQPPQTEKEEKEEEEAGIFANSGEKLKKVTKVLFVLGVISMIMLGIGLAVTGNVFQGIIIIAAGCLSMWVNSLVTFAYGEIVIELKKANQLNRQILEKMQDK